MDEIHKNTHAIGYSHEGEIRLIFSRCGMPEVEIERIMKSGGSQKSLAWASDYAATWRMNQQIRIDILVAVGYQKSEAEAISKRYSGKPSLEWGSRMIAIRERPKNIRYLLIIAFLGSLLIVATMYFAISQVLEIFLGFVGIVLVIISILLLFSLINDCKFDSDS